MSKQRDFSALNGHKFKHAVKETAGAKFEKDFVSCVGHSISHSKYYRIEDVTNTEMDKKAGTDFICHYKENPSDVQTNEIRLDTTLNFSHKNFMPYIADTGIEACAGHTFKLGVRHGSTYYNKQTHKKYTEFAKPVIVIGVDMKPEEWMKHQSEVELNLMNHGEELLGFALDCQTDYFAIKVEEREDLFGDDISGMLTPNPEYKKPEFLGEDYAKIQAFRESLSAEIEC